MLYPAPAAFAWSPLGKICVTENKYPASKKSIGGDPQAIRKYFDSHKQEASFNALRNDQDEGVEVSQQHSTTFEWKVDE